MNLLSHLSAARRAALKLCILTSAATQVACGGSGAAPSPILGAETTAAALTGAEEATILLDAAAQSATNAVLASLHAGAIWQRMAYPGPESAALDAGPLAAEDISRALIQGLRQPPGPPGPWSGTINCESSGTVTLEGHRSGSNAAPFSGDRIRLSFMGCKSLTGATVDGVMAMDIVKAIGSDHGGSHFQLILDADLQALRVDGVPTGRSLGASGILRLEIDSLAGPQTPVLPPPTTEAPSNGQDSQRRAGGKDQPAADALSVTNGRRVSVRVAGHMRAESADAVEWEVHTTQALVTTWPTRFPFAGHLSMNFADGRKISVQALLDGRTLRVGVDNDGDGQMEKSVDRPWLDFAP